MKIIDADDLKDWSEIVPLTGDGGIDINDFDEKLKSMPAIDAIPVVRCKGCKHRPTINGEWENGFDVEFPDGRCPCQCDDGWHN